MRISPFSPWDHLRALVLLISALASAPAGAQSKPIRLIVPYAAGGPIDVTARALAERVKDALGPVIVDNKPGAGGNLGADLVAKAAPDGLTIGIAATATHAINPWLFAKMPYDAARDFAPITQMLRVPNVLVMNADTAKRLQIQSLADLVRYAKAHPGLLNFGSGGNGSAGHLAGEMFKRAAGIFAVHIPYNGGNPAQLAVTTAQRSSALPEIPAMSETLKGFEIDTWWGLVAPAGTPREVVERLNKAFTTALQAPETRSRFGALLAEPVATTPEQFAAFMKKELNRYESVVKASGAKVD